MIAELAVLAACIGVLIALAWRDRFDDWDETPWTCICEDPILDEIGECQDCHRPHPSTLGLDW